MISRFFARRDWQRFPQDPNGDVLFRIWQQGDDLEQPRVVDFSIVFQTREDADACARRLVQARGEVEVSYFEQRSLWDLCFSVRLVPSWWNITEQERELEGVSAAFNGRNDGWGFFPC